MAKEELGTFKYLSPEEVDNIIRGKMSRYNEKGVRHRNLGWTEAEKLVRRQVILDYLGQGLSRRRIVEQLADRWGISQDTAYDWVADAYRYLAKDEEEFKAHNRNIMQERLENIMTEALDHNCYKEAVMACAELDKILGLQVDKKEIDVNTIQTKFKFGE